VNRPRLAEPPAARTVEDASMRVLEYLVGGLAAIAALLLGFLR
jgi:hypothetical protein